MTHEALTSQVARHTLTVEEVAHQLGVTPNAIRQAVRAGRLPAIKVMGQLRFAPEDVARLVKVRGAEATEAAGIPEVES